MGTASVHEAQYVAGASRIAEPPNLLVKDARLCAILVRSWSPVRIHNKATMACAASLRSVLPQMSQIGKEEQFATSGCNVGQRTAGATSGTEGTAFHKRCSASGRPARTLQTRWRTENLDSLRAPNAFSQNINVWRLNLGPIPHSGFRLCAQEYPPCLESEAVALYRGLARSGWDKLLVSSK